MTRRTVSIPNPVRMCLLALLALGPTWAFAETFTCTAGDIGCLIASIAKSNANGPTHDYLFLQAGTYQLTRVDNGYHPTRSEVPNLSGDNGLPVVTGALTIVGAGQGVTSIQRAADAPLFRLFSVAPTGGLTLAYVTVQGGEVDLSVGRGGGETNLDQCGGCILNQGSFMLWHATVRECAAWIGGGIDNHGDLTLSHTTILDNYAEGVGGGVATRGPTHIDSSWIGENVADLQGAGIAILAQTSLTMQRSVVDGNIGGGIAGIGVVQVTGSLVSENVSNYQGGGIDLGGAGASFGLATLDLERSTLWDNTAVYQGGGLFVNDNAAATLRGVAVLFNQTGTRGFESGGGIATSVHASDGYAPGTVDVERSWLYFNRAPSGADCHGNVRFRGWNVVTDPTRFHSGSPCE